MSLPEETTFEEVKIKGQLVKRRRAVIMDSGYDFVLSQIDKGLATDELTVLFREYFDRLPHDIFDGLRLSTRDYDWPTDARDATVVGKAEKAMVCGQSDFDHGGSETKCALPCSCITLSGNRRIKEYWKKPSSTNPPPAGYESNPIKTLDVGDQVWLLFMDKMGLFEMLGVLLNDFAYGGKYPIPSDEVYGLIMQKLINDINTGMSSRVKQRTTTALRSIGMERQRDEPVKLVEGMVQVNRSFIKLLFKLLNLLLFFYRQRRVQDVIVGVVSNQPSSAAYAAIIKTAELLKLSMQPFYYGSNYYDTLKGIVLALASLYILRATRDKYGIPMSYERFDQIIPAAYSNLLKSSQTMETNRYKIYESCARLCRDFVLGVSVLDTREIEDVKKFVIVEEDRVEALRDSILKATGTIDLADSKWQRDDAELPQKW